MVWAEAVVWTPASAANPASAVKTKKPDRLLMKVLLGGDEATRRNRRRGPRCEYIEESIDGAMEGAPLIRANRLARLLAAYDRVPDAERLGVEQHESDPRGLLT